MARDLSLVKQKFVAGIKGIYSTANFGATSTTSMTVEELQRIISNLFNYHNQAREAWDDFVALQGATAARDLIAETVDGIGSEDVGATLATVRTNIQAILDAYETQFGTGTNNKTFSYTLTGGLFTGGLVDIDIAGGVLTNVNTLCTTLRTSVEVLTPVN